MKYPTIQVLFFVTVLRKAFFLSQITQLQNILLPYIAPCNTYFVEISSNARDDFLSVELQFHTFPSAKYKLIVEQDNNKTWPRRIINRHFGNCATLQIQTRAKVSISTSTFLNLIEDLGRNLTSIKSPLFHKDVDKVVFLTTIEHGVKSDFKAILKSAFSSTLKFKVLIEVQSVNGKINAFTACEFCGGLHEIMELPLYSEPELFPDFHQNMRGSLLRISVGETLRGRINYTKEDGRYILTNGMMIPVVEHLASRLNFTYQVKPNMRGGGTGIMLLNGSWDGLVSDIISGDAEIAMSVCETHDRTQVVGFTGSVIWEHLTLIVPHGRMTYTWEAIFWPLSPTVWIVTLVLSAISTIYFYICPHFSRNSTNRWSFAKILECTFGVFLGQSVPLPKHLSISNMIYLSVWFISSISLTTAYLSKLVSFLSFPVEEKVPYTIEQLSTADTYKCGLAYVGGVDSLINTTKNPVFERILGKMQVIKNHSDCFTRPLKEKFVCLSFASLAQHYIYEDDELSDRYGKFKVGLSLNTFASFSCGIMMEKMAVFGPNFENQVQDITSMGLASRWEEMDHRKLLEEKNRKLTLKISPEQASYRVTLPNTSNNLLTLKHLHGATAIYCIGILVTLITFTLEIFASKIFHKIFSA